MGYDIKMIGGQMLPSRLEITPADKPEQKTIMIYKSLKLNIPLADDFFTTQNMKRVN
jgi:outer membrane lipoprotein-sorting protein